LSVLIFPAHERMARLSQIRYDLTPISVLIQVINVTTRLNFYLILGSIIIAVILKNFVLFGATVCLYPVSILATFYSNEFRRLARQGNHGTV